MYRNRHGVGGTSPDCSRFLRDLSLPLRELPGVSRYVWGVSPSHLQSKPAPPHRAPQIPPQDPSSQRLTRPIIATPRRAPLLDAPPLGPLRRAPRPDFFIGPSYWVFLPGSFIVAFNRPFHRRQAWLPNQPHQLTPLPCAPPDSLAGPPAAFSIGPPSGRG